GQGTSREREAGGGSACGETRSGAATEGSEMPRCAGKVLRRAQPSGVLALVVLPVLARLDRLPPVTVIPVPGDGLGQPGLAERVLGSPAERSQLGVVERVPPVVACAIVDVPDEVGIGAGQLENPVR